MKNWMNPEILTLWRLWKREMHIKQSRSGISGWKVSVRVGAGVRAGVTMSLPARQLVVCCTEAMIMRGFWTLNTEHWNDHKAHNSWFVNHINKHLNLCTDPDEFGHWPLSVDLDFGIWVSNVILFYYVISAFTIIKKNSVGDAHPNEIPGNSASSGFSKYARAKRGILTKRICARFPYGYRSSFTGDWSLVITRYSFFIVYCSLFIAHCSFADFSQGGGSHPKMTFIGCVPIADRLPRRTSELH
jgi:hypothetical protein